MKRKLVHELLDGAPEDLLVGRLTRTALLGRLLRAALLRHLSGAALLAGLIRAAVLAQIPPRVGRKEACAASNSRTAGTLGPPQFVITRKRRKGFGMVTLISFELMLIGVLLPTKSSKSVVGSNPGE